MADQHTAGLERLQQFSGFIFGKIIAPGTEGRYRYSAADAVKCDSIKDSWFNSFNAKGV
jgi:hypothetical protein